MYSFCIRYMEGRNYEHFTLGGGTTVANKTDGTDKIKMCYRSEKGFQGIAGNRFCIIED
jgi:tetrahydromethanopterin S-methyltransferase subunit E